jgi:hypothetical protein
MFDLPADLRGKCKQSELGENAFRVLFDCIVATQDSGNLPAGDPMPYALTAWSLVHGIAKLAISGNLPLDSQATLEFTHTAAMQLLRGIKAAASGI